MTAAEEPIISTYGNHRCESLSPPTAMPKMRIEENASTAVSRAIRTETILHRVLLTNIFIADDYRHMPRLWLSAKNQHMFFM